MSIPLHVVTWGGFAIISKLEVLSTSNRGRHAAYACKSVYKLIQYPNLQHVQSLQQYLSDEEAPVFGSFVLLAVLWLVLSAMIVGELNKVQPNDRWLTRRLWVRLVMVIGGPLTLILCAVGVVTITVFFFIVETVPDSLRDLFAPSPSTEA